MRPEKADFRSERPERGVLRLERADLRLKRADLRLERADMGPVRADSSLNQSPKGNMWSAIPVALLCMLVIIGDG